MFLYKKIYVKNVGVEKCDNFESFLCLKKIGIEETKNKKHYLNVIDDDGADVNATVVLVVGDDVIVNLRKWGADLLVVRVMSEQTVELQSA